jgi:hypothetical protein
MARYGATPLETGRWYYVSGVYDAHAQTLDVYLDGHLDNGFLLGPVTPRQHSSRSAIYLGRRFDMKTYEFAGTIEDVRIYSFALTGKEIRDIMSGKVIDAGVNSFPRSSEPSDATMLCGVESDQEDAKLPFIAAVMGALVAAGSLVLWPSTGKLAPVVIALGAGAILAAISASTLPVFGMCVLLLATAAGAWSIASSSARGPGGPS